MWLDILKEGLKEIKELIDKKKEKNQKAFAAVEAIYEAANETIVFLNECSRKVEKPNLNLSKIWSNAASKVRDLDEEMYWRLLGKAEYWSSPADWTTERIQKVRISIGGIREDSKKILSER